MLQSPHFLYRVQLGIADPKRAGIVGLTGFELATRLSFLLLGTTPTDALLDQAQAGMLDTATGAGQVVKTMLADPLARRGVKRFYEQWLPARRGLGADRRRGAASRTWATRCSPPILVEETSRFIDDVLLGLRAAPCPTSSRPATPS